MPELARPLQTILTIASGSPRRQSMAIAQCPEVWRSPDVRLPQAAAVHIDPAPIPRGRSIRGGAPILLGLPGLITSARAATPLPGMDEKDAVIAFGHPPRAELASRG